MSTNSQLQNRPSLVDLERMVELLANYICASEQPANTLHAAVARLQREVRDTHEAALRHLQIRSALPL